MESQCTVRTVYYDPQQSKKSELWCSQGSVGSEPSRSKSILQEHIFRPWLDMGRWEGWEEPLCPARAAGPMSRGNSPNRELGSEEGV